MVSTKAQLGFSMPLFLPSFLLFVSTTITVGLSSRPSSTLARLIVYFWWLHFHPKARNLVLTFLGKICNVAPYSVSNRLKSHPYYTNPDTTIEKWAWWKNETKAQSWAINNNWKTWQSPKLPTKCMFVLEGEIYCDTV